MTDALMNAPATAAAMVREGMGRIADVVAVAMLALLGWQVMFGGSQNFERQALAVGVVGLAAALLGRAAVVAPPPAMLVYVGVALLSAAVHQWPLMAAPDLSWWDLVRPAQHLLVMLLFVAGVAHVLRTAPRLAALIVLLALSILVLSVFTVLDRVTTGFVYEEGGVTSLPSVAQWGGMHQVGLVLVVGFPLVFVTAFFTRSAARMISGVTLGAGLLVAAVLDGSRSAIMTMGLSALAMVATVFALSRRSSRALRYYLPAAAVIGIGAWVAIGQVERSRPPLSSVASGRLPIWTAAARVVLDHPWLGVGPGNYRVAMIDGGYAERYLPHYANRRREAPVPANFIGTEQAHNMLLHVAAETGVVGAVSVLGLWGTLIAYCWKSLARGCLPALSCALMIALAAFFVRCMYDNFLDVLIASDRVRVLSWMLFAAALGLHGLALPVTDERAR